MPSHDLAAIRALYDLPLPELMFRAQDVHRIERVADPEIFRDAHRNADDERVADQSHDVGNDGAHQCRK